MIVHLSIHTPKPGKDTDLIASMHRLREPSRCCGGAGSFSLTHQELSLAIGARKAADIVATGAEVVATSCPGCRMQLADVLAQAGDSRPVVHTVELLAAAGARPG